MGPSPTIPTSFVPKQPVRPGTRVTRTGLNVFMVAALFLLGTAVVAAGATYGYGLYLQKVKEEKAVKIEAARASVQSSIVEEFVRDRDRFLFAEDLLAGHVATSGFFDILEGLTLVNVRYSNLALTRLADGSAEISLEGTARSFNALAAQSAAFSKELKIRRAIFSDIKLDPNGTVSFSLSAEADPDVFLFLPPAGGAPVSAPVTVPVPEAPVATTSAATTTP